MGKKRKKAISLTDHKSKNGQDRVIVHLRGRDWDVKASALDDAELDGNPHLPRRRQPQGHLYRRPRTAGRLAA